MQEDRCFRITERNVKELDGHCQRLIDAMSNWVEHFAPQVDDVIAEISTAFAETRLGDGIGLFQATGLDDYASDDEIERLRNRDEQTDWRRISYADLEACHAAPSFFDAKGFVFHLPAFLIAELNDRHPFGFVDRLFNTEEHPKGWSQLLSKPQGRALVSALILIREHPNYESNRDEIVSAIKKLECSVGIG